MKLKRVLTSPEKATSDLLAICYSYESKTCPTSLKSLDKNLGGKISQFIKDGLISHKKDTIFRITPLDTF